MVTVGLLALGLSANAMDWPQFRGPTGDGVTPERILKQWPAGGPRAIWRTPLTDGFSSFAISGNRVFTQVRRTIAAQKREVCVALNADTGAELWATPLGQAKYDQGGDTGAAGNTGGDGPRSTPTVSGDRVYVLTGYLVLHCLEAASGKVLWSKDLPTQYNGSVILWQNAASPVIEGDLIFVNANGASKSLIALRTTDGSVAWEGASDRMTQATPVLATIQGVRQVIFFTQAGLVAVTPATGSVLWRYAFPYNGTSSAASPVVAGDIVYCSSGYNIGAGAVRVSKSGSVWKATELWRKPGQLQNHWATPVRYNGFVYGLYGHGQYGTAPLKCVELATGREMWSQDGFGPGGMILVDGTLLVLADDGELVMVQPDPAAYQEVTRFQAVAGKCWNVPAVSNGRLYVRSTKEGVALNVAVPPPAPVRLALAKRNLDGSFQFRLTPADNSALDAARVGRLEVRAASSPAEAAANWSKVLTATIQTNGWVRVDSPLGGAPSRRFFFVVEQP